MKKRAYFASRQIVGWPKPGDIERYFLAPPGQRWFFETGNDSAGFDAQGVDGTESLDANNGRIDVTFDIWGNPDLGALMIWSKRGGGHKEAYASKGDLSRLRDLVHGMHGTPLPVGLFIPFEIAWSAVKEFLLTDGSLPKSIAWIANSDLPPNTFPDP
jgi:hypothetical protein